MIIPYQLSSSLLQTDGCADRVVLDSHPRAVFLEDLSTLPYCPSTCSFSSVTVRAPSCTQFTRSQFILNNLRILDKWPEVNNCHVPARELPEVIYLGKLESYKFSIEITVADYLQGTYHFKVGILYDTLLFFNGG